MFVGASVDLTCVGIVDQLVLDRVAQDPSEVALASNYHRPAAHDTAMSFRSVLPGTIEDGRGGDNAGGGHDAQRGGGAAGRPAAATGAVEDGAQHAIGAQQSSNMRQGLQSRYFVWLMVGLAFLGFTLAPFFDATLCHISAWSDNLYFKVSQSPSGFVTGENNRFGVPLIGGHFGNIGVSALLLAVFLDPLGRFDPDVALHVWARRYAFTVILYCAVMGLHPWVFAICPSEPVDTVVLYGAVLGISAGIYLTSQVIVVHVTLMRLRLVASPNAATRVGRLFKPLMLLAML